MSPIALRDVATAPATISDLKAQSTTQRCDQQHEIVLKTLRLLVADLCQQFNGGHPGGAIGMAAIGVALWRYTMRYASHKPSWLNRDRFILSNGHTCLFQYVFLHFAGYREMTFDQLKSYHSSREDSLCSGHPEIEVEGVEVTTGPLGQGVANAVGLAMATKHLAAEFNRPGYDIISNHTWCMVGDACLQEGVALEAISLAGHLGLGNLTVIYDNNQITCDGSVDMTNTEDINAKMIASGWNVVEIFDGSYDVDGIVSALTRARQSAKPTFINVHTIIGLGSALAGNAAAHGAALGEDDIRDMKRTAGFDQGQKYQIPQSVRDFFADIPAIGDERVRRWEQLLSSYSAEHPELAAQLTARMSGTLPPDWQKHIPSSFPSQPIASRASSGLVFNPLASNISSFMVGTADLSPSVHMSWPGKTDFQRPGLQPQSGSVGDYSGRYIHYGIREHAMAAIANGLAAFNPGTILPVTSSFFMFYLYAAPAVRMGALQHLQVIHAATHDSIGMGEDGPTHQPIELAALYRAMPNLLYLRPADSEETAGAWIAAINTKKSPSIISTSRHKVAQFPGQTRREGVLKGAYVVRERDDAELTVIGVGAEFEIAADVADEMEKHGVRTRLVSFPCQRLFEKQDLAYRRSVMQRHRVPAVVIEAYAAHGWERYADAAVCMKMDRFGKSLPGKDAYRFFGFTSAQIVPKVKTWLQQREAGDILAGEFVEL
jgi:dihydroxyacetone synthase